MVPVNKGVRLKESFCLLRYCFVRHKAGFSTSTDKKDETTHFGFQTVLEHEKAEKVNSVFEAVASSYDQMNDAMSFGIHRIWKDVFIQRMAPTSATRLLDVAGGTGDIAFRFLKYMASNCKMNKSGNIGHVTVCDINEEMLKVGQQRAKKLDFDKGISWLHGDAENLPLEDCSFSAYSIAFGIRNVTHINKVLQEAYRVLKPGGRFMCLEFSHVNSKYLQWAYDQYSFQIIPVMGQLIAGQWKPYQYLVESIRQFPDQEEFKHMIASAGFKKVSYENLTFGVVAIHSGFKL